MCVLSHAPQLAANPCFPQKPRLKKLRLAGLVPVKSLAIRLLLRINGLNDLREILRVEHGFDKKYAT